LTCSFGSRLRSAQAESRGGADRVPRPEVGVQGQFGHARHITSTNFKYYRGLKLKSKSHFYGRAAAVEVLANCLSALLRPRSGRRRFCHFRTFFVVSTHRAAETRAAETSTRSQQRESGQAEPLMLRVLCLTAAAMAAVIVVVVALLAGHVSSVIGHRSARSMVSACLAASRRQRSQPQTSHSTTTSSSAWRPK
jgi:hypothetical protein